MENNRLLTMLFLAVLCTTFALIEAPAEAEYSASASLGLREEYNDNVFLTSMDKKSDYITTVNPEIGLDYKGKITNLLLSGGLNYYYYANGREGDSLHFYGNLDSFTPLYKDIFFFKVNDAYSRVTIDQRKPVALQNVTVNLTDSNILSVNPYIIYPLGSKLRARMGYQYINQWYSSDMGVKYQSHTIEMGLTRELSQKITVSPMYDYVITDYINAPDYRRHDAKVEIQYQVTPHFLLIGTGGYTWLEVDMGSRSSPTWNISAKYNLTDALSLTASYLVDYFNSTSAVPFTASSLSQNYPTASAYPGAYPGAPSLMTYYANSLGLFKKNAASAGVFYSGNIPVAVTFTYEKDKYPEVTGGRKDEWKGVNISTSKSLTQKITGQLIGFYTNYKFLPEDESAKRYGVNVDLAYAFKIATLSLGYTYNRNNSNFDANDYSNNIVYLHARFIL